MKDHRSNVLYFKQLRKASLKKNQAWTGIEPMTSAIPVQRSNQLSYQANWELVTCEFVFFFFQACFSQLLNLSTLLW